MWIEGVRSVKETGGTMPSGAVWATAARKLIMFDNLIGNSDRNAGNILVGPPGDLVLIDHSRAFVTDKRLPHKLQRVDAELWERMKALTRENMKRALESWIDDNVIDAIIERRNVMAKMVEQLIATNGAAAVVIP